MIKLLEFVKKVNSVEVTLPLKTNNNVE